MKGTPILKSLVMHDQEDIQTHYRTDEFIFGDKILVCPILEANSKSRRMYLPKGVWYNYWTNKQRVGGKEIKASGALDSMPIYIKEGAIIPKYPVQQFVGEKEIEEVTLDVYFKRGKESSFLYDDAHDGYDYTKGRYSLRTFKLTGKQNELIIQQHKSGKFITKYKTFRLHLVGIPFVISKIQIDNEEILFEDVKVNGDNTLIIDKNFTELHIME